MMGLFGRGKEKKTEEKRVEERGVETGWKPSKLPLSYDLSPAQVQWVRPEDVDWTGWAEQPKPGLRWHTGDPVVFPKPPEAWKPVRWSIRDWRIPGHPAINPTTGREMYIEHRDGKCLMIFREGDGTERGILDFSAGPWTDMPPEELERRWIKPKDLKERERLVREFMCDSALFRTYLAEFGFVSGAMINCGQFPRGVLAESVWRTGAIFVGKRDISFRNPDFLPSTTS